METGLLIINGLLLATIAYQTYEGRRQRQESETMRQDDHGRRRKQGTIEFYSTLRTTRQSFRNAAERYANRDLMTDEQAKKLRADARGGQSEAVDAREAIDAHLAGLEWFAVGVNTKVFDVVIADRLAGTHLMSTAKMFDRYIEAARADAGSSTLYGELRSLAQEIERRRSTTRTDGAIDGYD